jgi:hypothetical protein
MTQGTIDFCYFCDSLLIWHNSFCRPLLNLLHGNSTRIVRSNSVSWKICSTRTKFSTKIVLFNSRFFSSKRVCPAGWAGLSAKCRINWRLTSACRTTQNRLQRPQHKHPGEKMTLWAQKLKKLRRSGRAHHSWTPGRYV